MTRCNEPGCDAQADFATPYGFRCRTHAMEQLTRDVADGNQGWMPIRFSRPDHDTTRTPLYA
jgi:hypothetical protein